MHFTKSLEDKIRVLLLFAFVGAGFFLYKNKISPVEEIHFHAGFQVYVNNQMLDFSDFKYMQIKPCGGDDHSEDEQIEKAHLHDGVGDVVHAHREGGTWRDLFTNIKYQIPNDKDPIAGNIVGYVNGQLVPQIFSMPIIANSSAVFFIGQNTDLEQKVVTRVTQEHIKEVEKKSENCGKN